MMRLKEEMKPYTDEFEKGIVDKLKNRLVSNIAIYKKEEELGAVEQTFNNANYWMYHLEEQIDRQIMGLKLQDFQAQTDTVYNDMYETIKDFDELSELQ